MMFLGAILFILIFVAIAPQSRTFLLALAAGAGTFLTEWAPFSYGILVILAVATVAGIYVMKTWPQRVDAGNPMAKYRNEIPCDED